MFSFKSLSDSLSSLSSSASASAATAPPLPLLIFIHGFLGSRDSFRRFPLDLLELIRSTSKPRSTVPKYDVLYHDHDTAGDNAARVKELVDYVLSVGRARP
ncbi:hypothetical protein HK101_006215, partial [Irineochytrium annulatum]